MDESNPASLFPWLELETLRSDDGRSTMRLRTLPQPKEVHAVREQQSTWESLPVGLSLSWVVGLGVYRADQRDGLIQVELALPTTLRLKRL